MGLSFYGDDVVKLFYSDDGLEQKAGELLMRTGQTIACAESCTGGLLTAFLTDVPGSSAYVLGSVVSYTNEVKMSHLKVQENTLSQHGAVSQETAIEMAEGIRRELRADIVIAITGIAGPGGATDTKPLGLVYIAVSYRKNVMVTRNVFDGRRGQVREQSVKKALKMLIELLEGNAGCKIPN